MAAVRRYASRPRELRPRSAVATPTTICLPTERPANARLRDAPIMVPIYASSHIFASFADDFCISNNGGCQQICKTLDGATAATCSCNAGYYPKADKKGCQCLIAPLYDYLTSRAPHSLGSFLKTTSAPKTMAAATRCASHPKEPLRRHARAMLDSSCMQRRADATVRCS